MTHGSGFDGDGDLPSTGSGSTMTLTGAALGLLMLGILAFGIVRRRRNLVESA